MSVLTVRVACTALASLALAMAIAAFDRAAAQTYAVTTTPNLEYVQHDGVKLDGDLYRPKGLDKAPLIIAVHGGGWQFGSPANYKYWGPYLARHGFALFAIHYRLMKPGVKAFPQAVYDVRAAIQFSRAKAAKLGIDPTRIALMGDSAGAHLAALTGLAAGEPQFSSQYRDDANAAVSPEVKVVVSFYGIYDMQAQWEHDQLSRPADQITEKFIGVPPMKDRRAYFDASPAAYATTDKNRTRFLLIQGLQDDIVDPRQATDFLKLLKQAGFFARLVAVPGAGHFFAADPIEEADSYAAQVAPQVIRFLQSSL